MNCQSCHQPDPDVLAVHAGPARESNPQLWHLLHGECFDEGGFTYGVDLDDIRDRGVGFWLEHVGGKHWAQFTDYRTAFLNANG